MISDREEEAEALMSTTWAILSATTPYVSSGSKPETRWEIMHGHGARCSILHLPPPLPPPSRIRLSDNELTLRRRAQWALNANLCANLAKGSSLSVCRQPVQLQLRVE